MAAPTAAAGARSGPQLLADGGNAFVDDIPRGPCKFQGGWADCDSVDEGDPLLELLFGPAKYKSAALAIRSAVKGLGGKATKAADKELSQLAKRRLAKETGDIPRSASPVAQGGSAKTGRWWEYDDVNGRRKIVVEHPDGSVHVGIPKPQSKHREGGPPKYYDYGGFGHIGK